MKAAIAVIALAVICAVPNSRADFDFVSSEGVFSKDLRGAEVRIPAPDGVVEVCDKNVRVWKYFQAVFITPKQHLIACFVPQDWVSKAAAGLPDSTMTKSPMYFVTIILPTLDHDFDEKEFEDFANGYLEGMRKWDASPDSTEVNEAAMDASMAAYSSLTQHVAKADPPVIKYLPDVERTEGSVSSTVLKTAHYSLDGGSKVETTVEQFSLVRIGPRIVILRMSALRPPTADADAVQSPEVQAAQKTMRRWVQSVLTENSK